MGRKHRKVWQPLRYKGPPIKFLVFTHHVFDGADAEVGGVAIEPSFRPELEYMVSRGPGKVLLPLE
jgi:hypothetical protein